MAGYAYLVPPITSEHNMDGKKARHKKRDVVKGTHTHTRTRTHTREFFKNECNQTPSDQCGSWGATTFRDAS